MLVIGQTAQEAHDVRHVVLHARVLGDLLGHASGGKNLGVHLGDGHDLLVACAVGLHERRAVRRGEEARTLEVVRKAVEEQLGSSVVQVAKVDANASLEPHEEVVLARAVVHGDHHEEVPSVLVAVHGGAEPSLEALVPDADASHGHIRRLVAHAELDVVTAHEEGQRQSVLADDGQGDAGEPPGAIGMVDLDVRALVLDDVGKVVDVEVLLDPPVDRGLVHVGDVLELARGFLER